MLGCPAFYGWCYSLTVNKKKKKKWDMLLGTMKEKFTVDMSQGTAIGTDLWENPEYS